MALITLQPNRLYLIKVGDHAVALIPSSDVFYAVGEYLTIIGVGNNYAYFYKHLMVNSITVSHESANPERYCIITGTNTISGDGLSISARHIPSCADVFSWADSNDINNPLFVRPAIEEVRKCVGFRNVPEYELRKFCI